MTDFDKLIKEKAEQAEYAYKPSAWRRFQRKSGLGHAATQYWVAGISSLVVVGGIAAFIGHRQSQDTPDGEPVQTVLTVDTLDSQSIVSTPEVSDTFMMASHEIAAPAPKRPAVQNKQTTETPEVEAPKPQVEKPAPKVNRTPVHGRPLVIDVDTIKENVPTDEELRKGNSRLF